MKKLSKLENRHIDYLFLSHCSLLFMLFDYIKLYKTFEIYSFCLKVMFLLSKILFFSNVKWLWIMTEETLSFFPYLVYFFDWIYFQMSDTFMFYQLSLCFHLHYYGPLFLNCNSTIASTLNVLFVSIHHLLLTLTCIKL